MLSAFQERRAVLIVIGHDARVAKTLSKRSKARNISAKRKQQLALEYPSFKG